MGRSQNRASSLLVRPHQSLSLSPTVRRMDYPLPSINRGDHDPRAVHGKGHGPIVLGRAKIVLSGSIEYDRRSTHSRMLKIVLGCYVWPAQTLSGSVNSYLRLIDSCITQLKAQGPVTRVKKKKKVQSTGARGDSCLQVVYAVRERTADALS